MRLDGSLRSQSDLALLTVVVLGENCGQRRLGSVDRFRCLGVALGGLKTMSGERLSNELNQTFHIGAPAQHSKPAGFAPSSSGPSCLMNPPEGTPGRAKPGEVTACAVSWGGRRSAKERCGVTFDFQIAPVVLSQPHVVRGLAKTPLGCLTYSLGLCLSREYLYILWPKSAKGKVSSYEPRAARKTLFNRAGNAGLRSSGDKFRRDLFTGIGREETAPGSRRDCGISKEPLSGT